MKIPTDIMKAVIDDSGVAVVISIDGDPIMTINFYREKNGSLLYVLQENAEDESSALWNVFPEYFEEETA